MARKTTKKAVRESLLLQLSAKRANVEHFADLVDDYMKLWEAKEKLHEDIEKRGVVYEGVTSTGFPAIKNNGSVKEVVSVNRQMLMILKELGLTTESVAADPGDDDDL